MIGTGTHLSKQPQEGEIPVLLVECVRGGRGEVHHILHLEQGVGLELMQGIVLETKRKEQGLHMQPCVAS